MEEAYFEEIMVYIKKRNNTVAQYILMRPILDLCKQSVRRTGAWVSWSWWEQDSIDLGGSREIVSAALDGRGGINADSKWRRRRK